MALITAGQIELVDLSDTRVAQLNLNTSLSKVQVQTNSGFSPDFKLNRGEAPDYDVYGFPKKNDGEQIKRSIIGLYIIPSLYFGQELISINNFYNKITYKIGDKTFSYVEGLDTNGLEIFVSPYGELVYRKNLDGLNNLFITAEIENYNDGTNYSEDIQTQIELTNISTANFLPIINYDKNIFSPYDEEDITLTAILYKDGEIYNKEVEYQWRISPVVEDLSLGTERTQKIKKSDINNIATVFCDMTVIENGQIYSTQVTISDKTDLLFSQIISSKGIAFTGTDEETALTCDIYQRTTHLNPSGSNNTNITYEWYYFIEGETDFKLIENSNFQTIKVIPQSYNTSSVTFRCIATYLNKQTTISQVAILISPEIKTIINPTQVFITTLETGALPEENKGTFSETIRFRLVDIKGNVLPRVNNDSLDSITPVFEEEIGSPFSIEWIGEEGKWDYNITLSFIENENIKFTNLKTSTIFILEFDYRGIELSDEFYLVKNIQGITGNGISDVIEYYAKSESNTIAPPLWDSTPPQLDSTKKYLWNYEEIFYTDGFSRATSPAVIGMYSEDGISITGVTNYYLAANSNTGITVNDSRWDTDVSKAIITIENKYLWNYEIIKYSDGTTTVTDPCVIGVHGENGNGITSIVEEYAKSSSNSVAPESGWSNAIPILNSTERFLWNRETTYYTHSNASTTKPCMIGTYSEDGRGITNVINYYLATSLDYGVNTSTSGWTSTIQQMNSVDRYLWNYEIVEYTTGAPTVTDPCIIGHFAVDGEQGVGVYDVVTQYCVYSSNTIAPTSGWQDSFPSNWSSTSHMWIRTKIIYTNGTVDYTTAYCDSRWEQLGTITSQVTTIGQRTTENAIINTVKTNYSEISSIQAAITNVTTEYHTSTSSIYAPSADSSGWSSTLVFVKNQYIWSRTVTTITKTNGSTETIKSQAVCISENENKYIISTTPQYYISTSNITAPGTNDSGWSDTLNNTDFSSNEEKKYIWTRNKIVYEDSSIAYSTPFYDSVFNNLTELDGSYSTQFLQLSDKIESKVSRNDFERIMALEQDGLHIKTNKSDNEVFIDEDSVDIKTKGETYSSFGMGYVQFGNYTIKSASDGGLIFVYNKRR